MTITSSIGYGLLPLDRIPLTNSKKSLDQGGAQVASGPVPSVSAPSVLSSRPGGLLSSINIAEVLKLSDAPPVDTSALKAPLSAREFLSESIKRSEATYAAGGKEAASSLTNLYTQKDVDTVRAATGYNVVVMNSLTTVVDDNGNPPPEGMGMQILNMTGGIEMARLAGGLTGEMTPEFLKDMFAGFAAGGTPLPTDWLNKALDFMGSDADSKAKD